MSAPGGLAAASGISLAVPAEGRFLRLARLTAAGMAVDLGWDVDDVEDVRIAVDELCAALIAGCEPEARLRLRFSEREGSMVVEGVLDEQGRSTVPTLNTMATALLDIVARRYALGDGGVRRFELQMGGPS